MRRALKAATVLGIGLTLAWGGVAPAQGIAKHDKCGRTYFPQSGDFWGMWKSIMDHSVAREAAGGRPGGGATNWNDHWVGLIRNTFQDDAEHAPVEHADQWIGYIVAARRAAHLPELTGMPQRPPPYQGGRCLNYED